MEKKQIIEKVAAGLRSMTTPPDYFVIIENEDVYWDEDTICNIPVLHTGCYAISFHPWSDTECPFIPMWKKNETKNAIQYFAMADFGRAYYEN
jgi:hypothetical protein